MASIIALGCDIAEIHHEYNAIHGALFGASSYRLVIAAMTGRTTRAYQGYLHTLNQLQTRLSECTAQLPSADAGAIAHQADHVREVMFEYASTLDSAMVDLHNICNRLMQDEDGYRESPQGGQSAFNRDKVHYDRVLLQLEKLGRQLNQLFSRFRA